MKRYLLLLSMLLGCAQVMAEAQNTNFDNNPPPPPLEIMPAYGFTDTLPSRANLCRSIIPAAQRNTGCGAVQWEPQSIEGPQGFPGQGPADGQIASGGNPRFPEMNQQTATRWVRTPVRAGNATFRWTLTQTHLTRAWQVFITHQNWNPNAPLTRASFDLVPFCQQVFVPPLPRPTSPFDMNCVIPPRTGYQVLLAVWTIGDTPNAFYQVLDVNFGS
ncbi:MAG: lytic polysaccharide monooxygenase [Symbiopectobacterium sp.]|uniref:lytic polysaccharide monooxygenase n=1 Tax=Symbiopectobacterium sp. TaxID=2952789 RepID=UPI0039EAA88F